MLTITFLNVQRKKFNTSFIFDGWISEDLMPDSLYRLCYFQPSKLKGQNLEKIFLNQIKDEFDQLNLYCYCLFGINGFVLFLCSLVISSRMLNHKTCYLLLMICTFLTAIVFLVILGLTVGISFTKGTSTHTL